MLISTSLDNRKFQVSKHSVCVKNVGSVSSKMKTNQYQGIKHTHTHTHTHTVFVFLVSRSQPLSLICFEMNSTYSPTQRKFVDKSLSFSRQMLAGIMKSIPA